RVDWRLFANSSVALDAERRGVTSLTLSDLDPAGAGASRGRQGRTRGRLPPARRAPPERAPCALLPDAGLGARRGGRDPGGASARVAGAAAVRGSQLSPLLALQDR